MSATIKDIARACNVSEGSVDRALNSRKGINEATKQRILQVANELRYKPNRVAQSLATGKTMTIGIICFDLQNNFFAELVDIVEAAAKEKEYFITLILTHGDLKKELDGIQYLASRKVDGLIIFPVGQGSEYIAQLKGLNVPVITIYNKISDDFVYIGVNEREIMCKATCRMVDKGYQQIIFNTVNITSKRKAGLNVYSLEQRLLGYLDGIKKTGVQKEPIILESKKIDIPFIIEKSKNMKTAILCNNDTYALGVMETCSKNGIRIPDQLGVMGFDNIDMLQYISPRLATVDYNEKNMGYKLFSVLYDLIQGSEAVMNQLNDYEFIEGETL